MALHKAGYAHIDLEERNVLVHDGQYRITDLHTLVPHQLTKECHWDYVFKDHVDPKYSNADFPDATLCGGINYLALHMGWWELGMSSAALIFLRRLISHILVEMLCLDRSFMVHKKDAPDVPPQYIIHRIHNLLIGINSVYTRDIQAELAIEFYQEVQMFLEDGQTVEEIDCNKDLIMFDIHKRWHIEQ